MPTLNLTQKNTGRFQKGMTPWNKGKERPDFLGEKHPNWTGKTICPNCKGRKSHVSNHCMKCSSPQRSKSAMGNQKFLGHKHTEKNKKFFSENRIANPIQVYKDTKIEVAIENLLKEFNIDYLKQIPLCKVTVSDFYIEKYNIAIFCDGCYWHGCKIHHSIDKAVELNKNQNRVLMENGISVIRLWGHEIENNPEECIGRIINLINFKQKNAHA